MSKEREVTGRPTRPPTHPGEILREDVISSLNISISEFARVLKISRTHIYKILNEEAPVTPNVALRIAAFLDSSPYVWVNLQTKYDLWAEFNELSDLLDEIKSQGSAA